MWNWMQRLVLQHIVQRPFRRRRQESIEEERDEEVEKTEMMGSFLKNGPLHMGLWRVSQISTLLCLNWYRVVWSNWMLLFLCWQCCIPREHGGWNEWWWLDLLNEGADYIRLEERKTGKQEDCRVTAGGVHIYLKMVQNLPVVTATSWISTRATTTMTMVVMDRWRQGWREVALFPPRLVGKEREFIGHVCCSCFHVWQKGRKQEQSRRNKQNVQQHVQ